MAYYSKQQSFIGAWETEKSLVCTSKLCTGSRWRIPTIQADSTTFSFAPVEVQLKYKFLFSCKLKFRNHEARFDKNFQTIVGDDLFRLSD